MAASEGERAALCRMARARRFAPGSGDCRAVRMEGASAMARTRVKLRGARSLTVRESSGLGSWVVIVRRISVSGGRRVGMSGGVLSSGVEKLVRELA